MDVEVRSIHRVHRSFVQKEIRLQILYFYK